MRRLLVVCVVLGSIALSGCDFLAIVEDLISDLVGGGSAFTFTSMVVRYSFNGQVMHKGFGVETKTIAASYESIADVVYQPSVDSYSSQSPINELPYIYINVSLDAAGSMITYIGAWRRTRHTNGAWERIDNLTAENIPLDREVGNSLIFRVDASDLAWNGLPYVDYQDWLIAQTNELDPTYRILDNYAAQTYFSNDPNAYIEIELRQ